jgi:hypothetical protein
MNGADFLLWGSLLGVFVPEVYSLLNVIIEGVRRRGVVSRRKIAYNESAAGST